MPCIRPYLLIFQLIKAWLEHVSINHLFKMLIPCRTAQSDILHCLLPVIPFNSVDYVLGQMGSWATNEVTWSFGSIPRLSTEARHDMTRTFYLMTTLMSFGFFAFNTTKRANILASNDIVTDVHANVSLHWNIKLIARNAVLNLLDPVKIKLRLL